MCIRDSLLPDLQIASSELEGRAILDRTIALARSRDELRCDPLLGQLPEGSTAQRGLLASIPVSYTHLMHHFGHARAALVTGGIPSLAGLQTMKGNSKT